MSKRNKILLAVWLYGLFALFIGDRWGHRAADKWWERRNKIIAWSDDQTLSHTPYSCESRNDILGTGWQPMFLAPRDGTVIEVAEVYGVAPWYGLHAWKDVHGAGGYKAWVSVTDDHMVVEEDGCLLWRPYRANGPYVDPTNG